MAFREGRILSERAFDFTPLPPQESGTRPIEVFMCSIIKKQGYPEGFKWITNFL